MMWKTRLLLTFWLALTTVCSADESRSEQRHWSFVPLVEPPLPRIANHAWPQNPIDRFVLDALERQGLSPSKPADKQTWLRRVTFALTGLPPSSQEIEHFSNDHSPLARQHVVDRLLASPRFGQRMASPWLDLARYADTHGYHSDSHRDMWRWRDVVIDALNQNMPFDRFTIEQLAGDLLPDATLEQRIASGFNRNNMINFEDGAIAEEYRTEYVADRVETTATVWLGLTMQCARCHDHKYDPLTMRDYYRMFAFFNQVPEQGLDGNRGNAEPTIAAPTRLQREDVAAAEQEIGRLDAALKARAVGSAKEQQAWERRLRAGESNLALPSNDLAFYLPLDKNDNEKLTDQVSGQAAAWNGTAIWLPGKFNDALLCDGKTQMTFEADSDKQPPQQFTLAAWLYPTTQDAMVILRAANPAANWTLAVNSNRVEFRIVGPDRQPFLFRAKQPLEIRSWQHLAVTADTRDDPPAAAIYINGQPADWQRQQAESSRAEGPNRIVVGGDGAANGFRGLLDEVRIYHRQLPPREVALFSSTSPIRELVAIAPADRTADQRKQLQDYFLANHDPRFQQLVKQRETAQRQLQRLKDSVPTAMVMRDQSGLRATKILEGGSYQNPGEVVSCDTPAVLPPMPADEPSNRLGLARWIVDPRNPLTARVAVNRFWQMHFGVGLVSTPEDFGVRGQPPSHPELLDWLAVEFIRSGWDVKHLHRLILTSATFGQSSHLTAQLAERDPQNRWLARGPRLPLTAEMVRDQALFVSGLLDERLGGPGVFPYQPKGLWKELAYEPNAFTAQTYRQSRGADLYRRSVYTFWKRAVPPPPMQAFGAPTREVCSAARPRVNSPIQALVLMNETGLVEAARKLAERILLIGGLHEPERLDRMFSIVLSRLPTPEERQICLAVLHQQRAAYAANPGAAHELLSVGESPRNEMCDAAELAAWTTVANMLLSLDESIHRN